MRTTRNDVVAVLEGMYAAEALYLAAGGPGRADFAKLAPYFAADVALHRAEGLPYGGTWPGHEGMERFFTAMGRTWEVFAIADQWFLSTGEPLVVLTHVRARSRLTGRQIDFPIVRTVGVRDGRISEIRPFYRDTAASSDVRTVPEPGV